VSKGLVRAASLLALALSCMLAPSAPLEAAERPDRAQLLGRRITRSGTEIQRRNFERLQAGLARAAALAASGAPTGSAKDARPVLDAWQGNGVPVTTSTFGQVSASVAPDGAGGAFVAFHDFRNLALDIFINRLDANGNYASGWSGAGLEVAVRDSSLFEPQVVSDGAGGAYVAFSEFYLTGSSYFQDVYLQRILGTGAIAGGWPAAGKKMNFGEIDGYAIAPDGTGGVLVGWLDVDSQGRVVRVNNAGNVVSGWPAIGIPVGPSTATTVNFTPDGAGGFYGAWASNDTVYCTRYAGTGALAPGWSAAGNVATAGGVFTDAVALTVLTSGDVMIGWTDYRFFDIDLFAVRMTATGGFATGWSSGGVAVCTETGALGDPFVVSDDAGGAVFFWTDFRALPNFGFYAQRITGAGAIASGWTIGGVAMCSPTSGKYTEAFVGDGAGGILTGWTDDPTMSGETDVYAQFILGNGTRPAAYPADGLVVCSAANGQYDVAMTTDAAGGAILAWDDDRNTGQPTRVYAARIRNDGTAAHASLANAVAEPGVVRLLWFSPDGASFAATLERDVAGAGFARLADVRADATGHVRYEDREVVAGVTYRYRLVVNEGGARTVLGEVTLRVPESLEFAIEAARPNPTAGPITLAFVLPAAAPATLELIDVSGRRVLSREVAGAGRQVLRLEESLAPGVYVVRLTQGGRAVTARVVVTE